MSERIFPSELHCPACKEAKFRVEMIPAHQRTYSSDGEHFTDHFGDSWDVECLNCEFQFTYQGVQS